MGPPSGAQGKTVLESSGRRESRSGIPLQGTDEAKGAHVGVGRVRSNPQPRKLCHVPVCPHDAGEQAGAGEAGPAQPAGVCVFPHLQLRAVVKSSVAPGQ